MNAAENRVYEENESDGDIPDEFSDIMENEFEENEERFEPRDSVSSRGTFNKFNKDNSMRNTGTRGSKVNPKLKSHLGERKQPLSQNFQEGSPVRQNPEPSHGDESSVITEVVEEKVVNIDSDFEEEHNNSKDIDQRNKQINEYLEMDKEEYLNREEYNMDGSDPEVLDPNPYENYKSGETLEKEATEGHELHQEEPQQHPEEEYEHREGYQYEDEHHVECLPQEEPEDAQGSPEGILQNQPYEEEYHHEQDQQEENEGEQYVEAEGELELEPEGELEGEEPEEEIKHAGLQTVFINEKAQHLLHYVVEGFEPEQAVIDVDPEYAEQEYPQYSHSPIQENEDEMYSSKNKDFPDYDDRTRLFHLANEVKKKDQGRKFVLWETNQMRNEWDVKEYNTMKKSVSLAKLQHHWNNDVERKLNSPKSKAQNYDFSSIEEQNLPVHKNERFYENTESRVPLLTDNPVTKKRHVSRRVEPGNSLKDVPKKNHSIHNVFLQSELQSQLGKSKKQRKAPLTHKSLAQKTDIKNGYAGRPIFGGSQPGNHHQNAMMGRARDFHSSHIF